MFTNHDNYPYLEEVNEGITRQLAPAVPGHRPLVLDVGCGQASLGAAISALGYAVWGIEQDDFAAAKARTRVDQVIQADLTDHLAIEAAVGDRRFDFIVFSDVLEHVYDPLRVLVNYLPFLAPNGRLLISLPNVGNWQTRLGLLAGRFDYQDSGVLDRTHIRFFTFATAADMVTRAGLEVERLDHTPLLVRAALPLVKRLLLRGEGGGSADQTRTIIDSRPYRLYMRWFYPIEYRLAGLRRTLFAFRILLVARPSQPAAAAPPWT